MEHDKLEHRMYRPTDAVCTASHNAQQAHSEQSDTSDPLLQYADDYAERLYQSNCKSRGRGSKPNDFTARKITFKKYGQEYAQVSKILGSYRVEALCFDGVRRVCHIRGVLRNKMWISLLDIILVDLREFQDSTADVILRYSPAEVEKLKTYGELPQADLTKACLSLHSGIHVPAKHYYDVAGAGGGRILVGRGHGFDVVHRNGKIDKAIDTTGAGNIVSIQLYEHHTQCIYTLCKAPGNDPERQVIVFNSEYKELNRWSVPDYGFISSIAVVSSRVFVADPDNNQVVVYTTDGSPLPPIKHSTFNIPVHLSICPPHHLLVSDCGSNSVYKVDVRGNEGTEYVFTWISTVVKEPGNICWYKGEIWVWSQQFRSVRMLTDTGDLKQELHHSKFLQFTDNSIPSIHIQNDVLWVTNREQGLSIIWIHYTV